MFRSVFFSFFVSTKWGHLKKMFKIIGNVVITAKIGRNVFATLYLNRFIYNISFKFHPHKRSGFSDERARRAKKSKFYLFFKSANWINIEKRPSDKKYINVLF